MKILFYLGHPAHYHLFKETIKSLRKSGIECIILIKTKDVLESLLKNDKQEYTNIYEGVRKDGFLSLLGSFLRKNLSIARIIRKTKPNLLVGSAAELAVLGRLFGIPSFLFFEDDFEAVPQFASIAGPLSTKLICPSSCSAGKWNAKATKYQGYHELAYLSPSHFQTNGSKFSSFFNSNEKNFLLRFSKLNAYHDKNVKGIDDSLALDLIGLLSKYGNVFISSERPLRKGLEKYRISINPLDMHDFLSQVDLFVGDSQTMTAEAAVLGTPSIRYNDFVGKLGYLEELEKRFQLTIGIKSGNKEDLLKVVEFQAKMDNSKQVYQERKKKMLKNCIDVNAFWTRLITESLHAKIN